MKQIIEGESITISPFFSGGKHMITGKSERDLLAKLEEFNPQYQTIVKSDQKVTLECTYTQKGLSGWEVKTVSSENSETPIMKKGKHFDSLISALKSMDIDKELCTEDDQDYFILCHRNTEPILDKGKVVSYWFLIDPVEPYVMEIGKPVFQVKKFVLNEWEYDRMMETRLGIYYKDILYPFSKTAIYSVGTLLDCASAFKNMDEEYLLGSAILIAEKMSHMKGIQCVYRISTNKVRPVMSLLGRRYLHIPQEQFFRDLFNMIAKNAVYEIEKWYITDRVTTVYIRYIRPDGRKRGLVIEAGDLLGQSLSVQSFYEMSGHYIYLKKNSEVHSKKYYKGGIERLMQGIEASFVEFEDLLSKAGNTKFYEQQLNQIRFIIGKKRYNGVQHNLEEGKEYDAIQLLSKIMDLYDMETSDVRYIKCQKSLRMEFYKLAVLYMGGESA